MGNKNLEIDITDKIEELFFETGEIANIEDNGENEYCIQVGDLVISTEDGDIIVEKKDYEGILFYNQDSLDNIFYQENMKRWVYNSPDSGTIEFDESEYKIIKELTPILESIPKDLS